jgi:hypothetical protein
MNGSNGFPQGSSVGASLLQNQALQVSKQLPSGNSHCRVCSGKVMTIDSLLHRCTTGGAEDGIEKL